MRTMTATEAKQNMGALLDAAQREPVTIRRQNRDVAVVLSPQEYERIRALNLAELDRLCRQVGARAEALGLTEEKLAVLLKDE